MEVEKWLEWTNVSVQRLFVFSLLLFLGTARKEIGLHLIIVWTFYHAWPKPKDKRQNAIKGIFTVLMEYKRIGCSVAYSNSQGPALREDVECLYLLLQAAMCWWNFSAAYNIMLCNTGE